ncbi:LOW QUALITY PROTEIN: hypothetical protein PHMEG_00023398 [Phytophthora megakarya]|uniref:Uncharacterized protein n=1 Tax=Phytophthora megakarya TaxID=4795 RepID=A0A225VJG8_9STRA|nr:LOW QUALITY PROTEIN: hypothetical protein PHMEG_00023398 [Phytophthora megakarya]
MQGWFASILRVKSALKWLHRNYKKDDYPDKLQVLGDTKFDLKTAEAVITPLPYTSYRLQQDENTVGDVVSYVTMQPEIQVASAAALTGEPELGIWNVNPKFRSPEPCDRAPLFQEGEAWRGPKR